MTYLSISTFDDIFVLYIKFEGINITHINFYIKHKKRPHLEAFSHLNFKCENYLFLISKSMYCAGLAAQLKNFLNGSVKSCNISL